MALTVTQVVDLSRAEPDGSVVYGGVYDVTFDSSYPTGGEEIAASDLDASATTINSIIINQPVAVNRQIRWDEANSKLEVYAEDGTSGVHAELANASDTSTLTCQILAFAS